MERKRVLERAEVLAALDEYYSKHKISAMNFACPSREACKAAAEHHGGTYVEATEAEIGKDYFTATPRIVVVSLDPGSTGALTPAKRTAVAGIREVLDRPAPKHKHWYRTHEGVHRILAQRPGESSEICGASTLFAHVRAVRCCANLKGRGQAPWTMYWSCRSYLQGEIEILEPEIIWTQGGGVLEAVAWMAPLIADSDRSPLPGVRRLATKWGPVVWAHTHHPTARNQAGRNRWQDALAILSRAREAAT